MANLKVVLELDSQGYIRNLKAADQAVKDFGRSSDLAAKQATDSMDKTSQSAGRLATAFSRLQGAVSAIGFTAFATNAIMFGDAIDDLSNSTDIAIPKILEIQKALQLAGGQADNTGKLITEFYKSLNEAAGGSDKTQASFAKLGISLNDLRFGTTEELLNKAAQGLANVQDPAQRTALALEIFGKAMMGVTPAQFAEELGNLSGQFANQAESIRKAAELTQQFENALTKLKLTFLEVFTPIITSLKNLIEFLQQFPGAIEAISIALLAIPGAFIGRTLVASFSSIFRGLGALKNMIMGTKTAADAAGKSIAGVGKTPAIDRFGRVIGTSDVGALAGAGIAVAAAGAAYVAGKTPEEQQAQQQQDQANQKRQQREVEIGKELQKNLESIQQISSAYTGLVEKNIQRNQLEMALTGMTKEQQDLYKGVLDIQTRGNETIAKLEELRAKHKGATAAQIDKEIAGVRAATQQEIASFQALQDKLRARRTEELVLKGILDLQEQILQNQVEEAQYAQQIDRSRLAAFEQVRALKEGLQVSKDREFLERSMRTLRQEDRDTAMRVFEIEQRRREELKRIADTADLPYEDRLRYEQQINQALDEEINRVRTLAEARKEEQDSFVKGWADALDTWRNNFKTESQRAADSFKTVVSGFESAIVRFVETGKLSFKDLFRSLLAEAARAAANRMLMSIFGFGRGFFGGIGFGTGMGFGNQDFGGFFADGGRLGAGKYGIAGENGPELITGPATITPLMAQPQATTINYNINAVDAASFRALVARDPQFIYAVTEQGRRSQPNRRLA